MRINIALLLLLLVGIAAAALISGGNGHKKSGKTVVAGFYPLAFAAQQIGGPGLAVSNLTPPGAEPHDLEATPDDVRALHDARLVLLLGNGFQPQLEKAAGHGPRVLELLDTPGLRTAPGDPHVWLDPLRFARIVDRIGGALGNRVAARRLEAHLRALDRRYRAGLSHCARREIVTSHEAFDYLARRYGLRQVPISGISPDAEPAPSDLQRVVDVVRQTAATTVFTEPLVSPRLAQTVARETGASTAVLNPIEGLTSAQKAAGADYFRLMKENLGTLRRGLGCR